MPRLTALNTCGKKIPLDNGKEPAQHRVNTPATVSGQAAKLYACRFRFMKNGEQVNSSEAPFGLAGLACLICLAILYFTTKPLLSHLAIWWVRDFIFAALPISAAFMVLYCSSWHRDLPRTKRVLLTVFSSIAISAVVLLVVGMVVGVILFFSYGPPVAKKL